MPTVKETFDNMASRFRADNNSLIVPCSSICCFTAFPERARNTARSCPSARQAIPSPIARKQFAYALCRNNSRSTVSMSCFA